MEIIRAEHLGMCFGVKDAIALALKAAGTEPLTVLGDLVHNESVLDRLQKKGIRLEQQASAIKTRTAMITAHGSSERKLNELRSRELQVLDATCPLVHAAHRSLSKLVDSGYHPVIIGKRDHVEVRGMTDDLADFNIVLSEADVANLPAQPRFGVISQTTQPIERVRALVQLIRNHFPLSEVRFIDTVCQPTKQRQNAAMELGQRCTVVIVVGGVHSNNTQELVTTCSRYCSRVHHIRTSDDLRSDWFFGDDTVGITAGTSTPDSIIDTVEAKLYQFASALIPDRKIPVPGTLLPAKNETFNRQK